MTFPNTLKISFVSLLVLVAPTVQAAGNSASTTADYSSRIQLPVTPGSGLDHPLPITAARGDFVAISGDFADSTALAAQYEQPVFTANTTAFPIQFSAQAATQFERIDTVAGDFSSSGLRGGIKAGIAIPEVRGLWLAGSLNAAYVRFDDNSETDVFAVLSARYQAPKSFIGQAMDFYSSLSLGGDEFNDDGLLLGLAVPLVNQITAGLEIATEGDQLTAYAGLPLGREIRLTGALGVADGIDILATAQLTWYLGTPLLQR